VLSGCFSSRHLPDSSLVHFRKACTSAGLARSIPLMAGLYLLRVLQGGCTDGLNAAGYADSAVFWAGRLNDPVLVKSYSDSLARFFSKNHLPALREKYARFSHHMADSIRRMKGSDELAGNEILLSSVATEQALNHLNKQQYYQDKSDRNLHTVFPVFFVLFTLLIFSLHFFSFRKKRLNPVILPISDASTLSDISKEPENHQRQSGQDKFLQISARLEELMVMQKPYLDKNLSLHDLAGMLSTNKTYVSQVINQQYGLKFNDYINGYRVKEACRLLRFPENKTTSIEHISERSGFNSISTFYHSFHKFAGMSPARFIKGIPLE
ncbi:MAG: AraC family transcriptional regulator, partial [Bacteroidota bacterium]